MTPWWTEPISTSGSNKTADINEPRIDSGGVGLAPGPPLDISHEASMNWISRTEINPLDIRKYSDEIGDLNGDGVINGYDMTTLLNNWGTTV